jgi:hypothetical protein
VIRTQKVRDGPATLYLRARLLYATTIRRRYAYIPTI